MIEYIEREKAQDGLDSIDWYHVNDKGQLLPGGKSVIETYVPFKAVEEMLESIPAADVRPVVRGKWNRTDAYPHRLYCSVCYETYLKNDELLERWEFPLNFCPNCGARMEES